MKSANKEYVLTIFQQFLLMVVVRNREYNFDTKFIWLFVG